MQNALKDPLLLEAVMVEPSTLTSVEDGTEVRVLAFVCSREVLKQIEGLLPVFYVSPEAKEISFQDETAQVSLTIDGEALRLHGPLHFDAGEEDFFKETRRAEIWIVAEPTKVEGKNCYSVRWSCGSLPLPSF